MSLSVTRIPGARPLDIDGALHGSVIRSGIDLSAQFESTDPESNQIKGDIQSPGQRLRVEILSANRALCGGCFACSACSVSPDAVSLP